MYGQAIKQQEFWWVIAKQDSKIAGCFPDDILPNHIFYWQPYINSLKIKALQEEMLSKQ